MAKKNTAAKVFAIFALLWIVISVVGTGILVLTTPSTPTQQVTLTPEEVQDLINQNGNTTVTVDGEEVSTENDSLSIEDIVAEEVDNTIVDETASNEEVIINEELDIIDESIDTIDETTLDAELVQ